MTKAKIDIYQEVTDYIIELLESADLGQWETPFSQGTGFKASLNPTTGKLYNGINSIVLWVTQLKNDYSCNEWATFKQWKEQGATIKKGSKACRILYYSIVETGEKVTNIHGEEEDEKRAFVKYYSVFNADQVEGYTSEQPEKAKMGIVEQITKIEDFIKATGADVRHGGNSAYYRPEGDYINMPAIDTFFETSQTATENYYATLLHELTHWTGAATRLKRFSMDKTVTKEEYAFEELIAELGCAFLSEDFGFKCHGRKDHAQYIKSWLKALKNDKTFIFKASSKARKAAEYLTEKAGQKVQFEKAA